jgi:hypothetical protein
MCATNTCTSVLAASAQPQGKSKQLTVVKAIKAMVEAFREALDLRCIAVRSHRLGDE